MTSSNVDVVLRNGPAVFAVTATYDPFNRTTTISNEKHFVHFTDASGVLSVTASSTTVFNIMSTTTIIIVCVAALILIALIIDIIALFVWRKRGQYSELNCKIWAFKYDKRQKLKVYTRRVRSSIRMSHNCKNKKEGDNTLQHIARMSM